MKKSKILAISLGSVALATLAISTPVVLASCSSDKASNLLLSKDAIKLSSDPNYKDYKLEREQGTNNYTLISPKETWSYQDMEAIEKGDVTQLFSKEELMSLGFSKDVIESQENNQESQEPEFSLVSVFGIVDKKGNAKYEIYDVTTENDFDISERNKPAVVINTIKICQINNKTMEKLGQELMEKLGPDGEPTPEQYSEIYKKSTEKTKTISFTLTIKSTTK